ncbi:MAG: cobalamin biosynthesis protein CbiX [Hyphomicrobiales bacterium]|nr:cobalamin biosynthesis protein CbiX [Hyphomicrobiales bacterium]MCP5374342.1 cobalamin biosynthesis protein CbiX [Hyphomicrobiales bacterium]
MPPRSPAAAPALADAALVIVGHGSSISANSSLATTLQGNEIRRRNLFAEVHEAFWKEAPFLGDVLDDVAAPRIFVVPNLACRGYITSSVIPRTMGLTGRVTERIGRHGHQTVVLCEPVGTNPRIARVVAGRAEAIVTEFGLAAERTCLMLVGHGSKRNAQSSIQTQAIAAALADQGVFAEVTVAFLEQDPTVANWRQATTAESVIVMPFMISNGLHGAEDVPALLGIDPADPAMARMAEEGIPAGPYAIDGRRVWYCRAVGSEPGVADIIVDQVLARI